MSKIAIIVDSTICFTQEQMDELGLYTAPLKLIDGTTEYIDMVTINNESVKDLLRQKKLLTTSQPSMGETIEILEKVKEGNYDHIYVVLISRKLSGTYSNFVQAIETVGLDNITIFDTLSIAGPLQSMVGYLLKETEIRNDYDQIAKEAQELVDDSVSYVYPRSLETLKRGGRISSSAAAMASLFKIKPILYLDKDCESIDKLNTARTENKVYALIMDDVKKRNITPQTHDLYILDCEGKDIVAEFEKFVTDYDKTYADLPAVIATHAGLETIAVQFVKKINK